MTLPVSVEDVYHGKVVEAHYLKMVACEKCRGTGGASPKAMRACGQCGGQGFGIQEGMDYYGKKFVGENTCHACQGWGKQATTLCSVCHGAKVAPRIEKVKIQIPNGLPDGNTLRIPNFGDEPVIGAPADLEVTIVEIPTEHWSRKNNDLYYTMEISLKEAIFGFTKSFTHLNGQSITITRKEVTNKDTMMTRPDEGILNPKTAKSGRLVIKFRIRMEQFTDRQLDMWE